MGGGDLNLKKSWHPQTIRNVERVWKAEQKATAEAKKIEQLQRELQEERSREEIQRHAVDHGVSRKKSERLDWMYSAPGQVDKEQYLLGKAVDKHVDPLAKDNEQDNAMPGASFSSDGNANTPADLAAKVRDDPLFLIKKKEEEKKKELINNPIKMKQLRQMLQDNLTKSKKKDKKKKKKGRKEKKKRNKDTESEDSDSGDDVRRSDRKDKRYGEEYYHNKHRSSEKHSQRKITRRSRSLELSGRDNESRRHRKRSRQDIHVKQSKSHSRRSRSQSPVRREEQNDKKKHHQRSLSRSLSSDRQRSRSPITNGHVNNTKTRPNKSSNHRSFSPSPAKKSRRSPCQEIHRYRESPPMKYWRPPSPRRDRQHRKSPSIKTMRSPSPRDRPHRESPPMKSRRSPSPRYRQHRESQHLKSRRSPSPRDGQHRESPPMKSRRSPSPRDGQHRESQPMKSRRSPSPRDGQHRESPPMKSRRSPSPRDGQHRESPPMKPRRSRSPRQNRNSRGSAVTKKMTTEELEKKREEMLDNAKWRNDQRTTNVKRYREKEEVEANEEAQNSGRSAEFISSMKVDSFSSKTTASVSDRIKRNINSLQRTKADLDTFLVKK